MANPGRYVAAGSSIHLRRSVRNALAHPAPVRSPCVNVSDAGRAAAGRACSFNSGKNGIVLPEVKVRRTGAEKENELADRRRSGPRPIRYRFRSTPLQTHGLFRLWVPPQRSRVLQNPSSRQFQRLCAATRIYLILVEDQMILSQHVYYSV